MRWFDKFCAFVSPFRVVEVKPQAIIEIGRHGQLTKQPQVTCGFASKTGLMSVFTKPDNDAGNAYVEMMAKNLSNLTGISVVDRRPFQALKTYEPIDINMLAYADALIDLRTHRQAWRRALEMARDWSTPATEDQDDRSYWEHEIAAFDRTMKGITGQ